MYNFTRYLSASFVLACAIVGSTAYMQTYGISTVPVVLAVLAGYVMGLIIGVTSDE